MEESYVVLSYPGRCTFFIHICEFGATLFAISAMVRYVAQISKH